MSTRVNQPTTPFVALMFPMIVVVSGLLTVLGVLPLYVALTTILATSAAVGGLGLGLGQRGNKSQLFKLGGFGRLGKTVDSNTEFGRFQVIDLRSSIIESHNGQLVIRPNQAIYQPRLVKHVTSNVWQVS